MKDVTLSKYVLPVFTQVTDIVQISVILFIPFTLCVLFAMLTVITIKSSTSPMLIESKAEKQHHTKERTITHMLLTVVIFYLLSLFFVGLRYVLPAKLGRVRYYSHGLGMTIFDCIATNILLLNSSVNLILYSAMNVTFREIFTAIFFRKVQPNEISDFHSVSSDTVNSVSVVGSPELEK